MTVIRRLVLPALIALMVVTQVVIGAAGASGIRADHRRNAALAKERRDVAAYRKQVMPLATQVFDVVQPLQDVEDAFAHPAPGLLVARDDVLAHSGTKTALAATTKALSTISVPKTLRGPATDLTKALADLTSATDDLAAATTAKGDRTGFVAAYDAGYDALASAEIAWLSAVTALYGEATTLPTPAQARGGAHGRKTATHGSYLQQADLICGRGEADLLATGAIKDQASAIKRFPTRAAIILRVDAQLKKLRADPASASYLHRSQILLSAADEYPRSMLAIARAYNASNQAAFDRSRAQLLAALPSLRDLSRSFKAYGANLCARAFNVDAVLNPKGGKSSGGLSA